MSKLRGLQVLVTRPSPAGEELCKLIDQEDGKGIHFPTLAFGPPHNLPALEQALATVGTQDWLLFISPQAVYASVPLLRRAWPNFPPQLKLAAVGLGTAKALHAAGYVVTLYPTKEWNSEGILDLPEFRQLKGAKITLVKGEGGRDLLSKAFAARGVQVTNLIVYERVLPTFNMSHAMHIFKENKIDVIIGTSFEGVRNLKTLLASLDWSSISSIPLIVVSERIKKLAQDLDFQRIWVARNASSEAILEILAERRNELCRIQ